MNKLKMYVSALSEWLLDPLFMCIAFLAISVLGDFFGRDPAAVTAGDIYLAAALVILAVREKRNEE